MLNTDLNSKEDSAAAKMTDRSPTFIGLLVRETGNNQSRNCFGERM